MDTAWTVLFLASAAVLTVCAFVCILHALKGPHTADRIVFINMISSVTVMLIAVISALTQESFLVDIALIYAMLGFLAVVLLAKIFISVRSGKGDGK